MSMSIKPDIKYYNEQMKLVLATQGSQGIVVLRELFGLGYQPYEIMVVVSDHGENAPLFEFLNYLELPINIVANSDEFDSLVLTMPNISEIELLSISWRYRFSPEICKKFINRSINLHPGLLPEYRGCFSGPWSIINNEEYSGFTFHEIAETFDTGKIYLQKKLKILPVDTGFSLNYRVMQAAISSLAIVLNCYRDGGIEQTGKGHYYPNKLPFNGEIDPCWTQEQKERFVRAMYFPPHEPAKYGSET